MTNSKDVKEDFSMGVGGCTGLNQGIPHGGPGKGVLPKPLFDPSAKAVPPKEEEDEDTEKNKKAMKDARVNENKKPFGSHLGRCKNCGSGWKYTYYMDQLTDDVYHYLKAKGYSDNADICLNCIKDTKEYLKNNNGKTHLSKNLQLYVRKKNGDKTRLQFVSPAEAESKEKLIDIANTYTHDWKELWTIRYELDDKDEVVREIESNYMENPALFEGMNLEAALGILSKEDTLVVEKYRYTMDDVEQYLYQDLGFNSDEVDDLVIGNEGRIIDALKLGKTPAEIAADLDDGSFSGDDDFEDLNERTMTPEQRAARNERRRELRAERREDERRERERAALDELSKDLKEVYIKPDPKCQRASWGNRGCDFGNFTSTLDRHGETYHGFIYIHGALHEFETDGNSGWLRDTKHKIPTSAVDYQRLRSEAKRIWRLNVPWTLANK